MVQEVQPHLSLLSLSIAAASAAPIPAVPSAEFAARSSQGVAMSTTRHRRLSSAGRSRRRLSDARDAATRPFPTSLQTASASLAALSLSSPALSHRLIHGAPPVQVPQATSVRVTSEPEPASVDDTYLSVSPAQSNTPLASNSVNGTKSGRKRGTIFTCESCSKVYRHPSCLIKHRWEHTPHWREASKFVLSKHQQVQLLEAAAILSHLSPSSASLPEDRSLWPSFLSGGLVPPPASAPNDAGSASMTTATPPPTSTSDVHTSYLISSSVPASTVLGSCPESTGPRLHDYAISGVGIGIQVRPGMLGVPTAPLPASSPVPVPAQHTISTREDDALNLLALRSASMTSGSWGSPTSGSWSVPLSSSLSHPRSHGHSHSLSYSHSHSLSASDASKERERRRSNTYEYGFVSGSEFGLPDYKAGSGYGYTPNLTGGWSLPRSSVRSKSGSSGSQSRSQSASESRSEDEDEVEFGDADLEDGTDGTGVGQASVFASRVRSWKTEDGDSGLAEISMREDEQEDLEDEEGVKRGPEQPWDGMEMEMEMEMD